jgi:hypothetical protein
MVRLPALSLTAPVRAGTLAPNSQPGTASTKIEPPFRMSKPMFPALAQFVTATAGRNMTKAAYVAVTVGVVSMVLLTLDPAYETAHHWVDFLLWTCLLYFVFEWLVRLRHMARQGRLALYLSSSAGLVDALGALAVPVALILGAEPKTAWLLSVLWVLKVVPGIPGLRQLRRVLVLESGPLLSVLVIFLMVVFLASVAVGGRHADHDGLWRRRAGHAARPHGGGTGDDLRPRRVRPLDRYSRDWVRGGNAA